MAEPRFLLDTNICIYILQGFAPPLRRAIERHAPGELAASAISHAELMRGIAPRDEEGAARAERLFDAIPVLPFDRRASTTYRQIPFRRGTFDRLIAAHTLSLDLTLVTNNERDFDDVPGLRVENWTA